jgi:putative aminopeptidase FrvX
VDGVENPACLWYNIDRYNLKSFPGIEVEEQNPMAGLFELIMELCRIPGAPGFEHDVVAWLQNAFHPHADKVEVDSMGNLYALRQGDPGGPTLMISAHSDEIGGVVRAIEPDGFLRFNKLGGLLDSLAMGRKVIVNGHLGVIGLKAGHAQTADERLRVPAYTEQYIDVGADSADDVAGMGIRIGDPVTYVSEVQCFSNPDRFVGKALDNRLGCVVLLALLERLQGAQIAGTLHIVVTVQEEVGLRGARVAANRIGPDCAVVVDTMPCGDTPDMTGDNTLPIGIGKGPVFRLVSRGDVTHHGLKRLLIETAEAQGIPYQLVVHDRSTTDASAIHLQRQGIPTGVVTIPRRYAHSPVEVADMGDVRGAIALLEAVVARMGELESFLSFVT